MRKMSIVELVAEHATRQPDKLCLVGEDAEVTYREYFERIKNLAVFFQSYKIKQNSRVVFEAQHTVDYLASQLALHLLGGIFVPVEKNCAVNKILEIAKVCDAELIVTSKKANSENNRWITYQEIKDNLQKDMTLKNLVFPRMDMTSEILFSTGTTGRQKGIELTHENNFALAQNVMYGVEMELDNIEMIPSPMNHSHGLRRYYGNMLCGSTVILISGVLNISKFFYNMDRYRVNSLDLVPTALSVLLKLSKGKIGEYKDILRYVQLGAAPLMEADKKYICDLLPNTRLYNFYGSTESGCICIYNFNGFTNGDSEHRYGKEHCIGKPTFNAEIRIVDQDRNVIDSSSVRTGTLASKGAMNMKGYWMDDTETKSIMALGYIYSNDEAYVDEGGDIILLGRKGDVINVGGNKVSPEEIEDVVMGLYGIIDSGCIPIKDEIKGQVPKLYVQLDPSVQVTVPEIRAYLQKGLEPYKVPKLIEVIERIPRSYNGKLLRSSLMEMSFDKSKLPIK